MEAEKRCHDCSRPARPGKTRCRRCAKKQADDQQKRIEFRKKNGLCAFCGKVETPNYYCAGCGEEHTKRVGSWRKNREK